jgi:hypothetical protein
VKRGSAWGALERILPQEPKDLKCFTPHIFIITTHTQPKYPTTIQIS